MPRPAPPPFRGRQAEAHRNDERILRAALEVFTDDRGAPMAAVAARANVGQASLYRRYPSKDALLARVCERGMAQIRDAALAVLHDSDDPWDALSDFLDWYLKSGTQRLAGLLGSFAPEEPLFDLARETNRAMQAIVDRVADAGMLRTDVTGADLTLIVTQITSLNADDPNRTDELRERYLTLALQGLSLKDATTLPGPAPDADELELPWRRTQRRT